MHEKFVWAGKLRHSDGVHENSVAYTLFDLKTVYLSNNIS